MNLLTPTQDHISIKQEGATGLEAVVLQRSGPGVAVWSVETSCKRNAAVVGYSGGVTEVMYSPQDTEPEWDDDYTKMSLGIVELRLPVYDHADHWVVDSLWDKYGGWIVAFLMPTTGEMFTPEQLKILRGGE